MAGMNPTKLTSAPEGFEYYRVCDRDGVCRVVRGSKQALNLTVDSSRRESDNKPIQSSRVALGVIDCQTFEATKRGEPPCRASPSGRPGRTRRGVKVGIRFRLQGRFTAPSRQSPQVERKSDQSTRRRPSPTQQFSFTLDGNSSWLRPDGTDALQRLTGLFRPSRCIRSRQQDGDMTELATGGLR